ncbi:MAG: T9SS type A sorting domain-containing protein [Candidatus Cloacimonadota bacterium]|nr:T9SS type A sorting domain-containing protein [Candidatus Cloacimonadota bacterium]
MKKIVIILFGVLLTASITTADTNIPGGNVSGIWTFAGSPYIIDGEIQIQAGDTLIIEPGVEIQFSGHYKFNVYGRLLVEGNADSLITFTAQDTSTGWHGLRFYDTNINGQEASSLVYCTLEYGRATGAESSGGAVYLENSDENFQDVTIHNNYAAGYGGGTYFLNSNPNLTNVSILDNSAYYDGGGVFCFSSSPSLIKVTISGNTTEWNGGGIACFNNSNPELVNVTISQNISYQNGCGIACLYNSSVDLLNSIVWNNDNHEIFVASTGEITVEYSDVLGDSAGIEISGDAIVNWLEGNIDEDPLFVNPFNHDYNLQAASPCIDAGDPDPFYNDPDGTRNDMGAYCFHQSGIRGTVTITQGSGNVEDVVIEVTGDTITSVSPSENGTYTVTVSAGTYNVTATLEEYFPYPVSYDSLVVGEGELVSGIDFDMSPILPGSIEGKVDIAGLGDVEDVEITAGEEMTNPYPVYDPWGVLLYYYYILEIAPGIYDVTASLTGYQDSTVTDVIVQSMQQTLDINFVLQPITYEGYISGTVTLKNGTGNVEDVEVSVPGFDPVHPDANGDYLLTVVNGTYDVTASLEGYTSITIRDVVVIPDQTITGINMTLINWEIIPGTQYNMTVFTTVTLDGKFVCGDSSNQVAAFGPGGENDCRGIAIWQEGNHSLWSNYWDLSGYWHFTIVSNNNSGETIRFKLYETQTDSIYDYCYESIIFVDDPDTCSATAIDLNAPSPIRDQQFNLIEEWNWISFNLHPENPSIDSVFASLTPNDIYQVKNQTQASTYFPGGWVGDLNYITDGEGYLVNMINSYDGFTLSGEAINPIIHPIDLVPNWNWVGYYPYVSLTLPEALASISATVVKTQDKSAVYDGGWLGDLTQMEPGVGYKICMTAEGVLTYPGTSCYRTLPLNGQDKEYNAAGWEVVSGTQANMIAMVKIILNEEVINNSEDYVIGVFDNEDNCRSIGKKVYDFWYFTIVGNVDGAELHFKVYNLQTEKIFESNEKIIFQNDAIIGSPEKAIIVTCNGSNSDIPEEYNLYNSHPNPFYNSTSIKYQIPKRTKVNISIYNILGQKVKTLVNLTKDPDTYLVKWNGKDAKNNSLPSGIYFYKLTTDKYTEIQKLVKLK